MHKLTKKNNLSQNTLRGRNAVEKTRNHTDRNWHAIRNPNSTKDGGGVAKADGLKKSVFPFRVSLKHGVVEVITIRMSDERIS
jgi:hypothetical protein